MFNVLPTTWFYEKNLQTSYRNAILYTQHLFFLLFCTNLSVETFAFGSVLFLQYFECVNIPCAVLPYSVLCGTFCLNNQAGTAIDLSVLGTNTFAFACWKYSLVFCDVLFTKGIFKCVCFPLAVPPDRHGGHDGVHDLLPTCLWLFEGE